MPGLDDQDQSEVFDEENTDAGETGGLTGEYRTFEDLPLVLDVTSADGDADDGDFDEDDQDLDEDPGANVMEPDADPLFGADGFRVNHVNDPDPGADAPGVGEVELVYSGLMENVRGAQASAAHWEARALSDDDIEDLGYGPEGDEK